MWFVRLDFGRNLWDTGHTASTLFPSTLLVDIPLQSKLMHAHTVFNVFLRVDDAVTNKFAESLETKQTCFVCV